MADKKIRGVIVSVHYMPPIDEQSRLALRIRRRAPKGAKYNYGDTLFDMELSLESWTARSIVKEIRSGLQKIRLDREDAVRSMDTWLMEFEKAAKQG